MESAPASVLLTPIVSYTKLKQVYEEMMQPENRERFNWSDFPSTHRVFTGMSDLRIQEMKAMNKKVSFLSISLSLSWTTVENVFVQSRRSIPRSDVTDTLHVLSEEI